MSAPTAAADFSSTGTLSGNRVHPLIHFILFLVLGLAVIIFGSNYFEIFVTNRNPLYNGVVAAALLAAALWLKRDARWNRYWRIAFAFFIAAMVNLVPSLESGSGHILGWLNISINSSEGVAIDKLYEVLIVVIPILVLNKLSRADLGSVFLRRGDLKLGLSIGGLVWLNLAASSFLFFATRFESMPALGAAVLWGLVFSFANGFMEELWIRGIFLKRLQPFLGIGGSVLLTSIVFSLMHGGALYLQPIAIPFMVANTLTLGLACGYMMLKTDSIWGATLIHAGADFFLFIAMLASV
jgi:membrane protease YdiL (CAAX protease family)